MKILKEILKSWTDQSKSNLPGHRKRMSTSLYLPWGGLNFQVKHISRLTERALASHRLEFADAWFGHIWAFTARWCWTVWYGCNVFPCYQILLCAAHPAATTPIAPHSALNWMDIMMQIEQGNDLSDCCEVTLPKQFNNHYWISIPSTASARSRRDL